MGDGDIDNKFSCAIGSILRWKFVYGFEVIGQVFSYMEGYTYFQVVEDKDGTTIVKFSWSWYGGDGEVSGCGRQHVVDEDVVDELLCNVGQCGVDQGC